MSATTAEQRRYWSLIVRDGCVLCGGPAEVAHAHGGSIVERMQEPKAKGKKLPHYQWLVIPLCPAHGRVGPLALDTDVAAWEARYGSQVYWLDRMIERTGVDVWQKARSRHAWAEAA